MTVSFISTLLSYLLVLIVFVAAIAVAVCIGFYIKRSLWPVTLVLHPKRKKQLRKRQRTQQSKGVVYA